MSRLVDPTLRDPSDGAGGRYRRFRGPFYLCRDCSTVEGGQRAWAVVMVEEIADHDRWHDAGEQPGESGEGSDPT